METVMVADCWGYAASDFCAYCSRKVAKSCVDKFIAARKRFPVSMNEASDESLVKILKFIYLNGILKVQFFDLPLKRIKGGVA